MDILDFVPSRDVRKHMRKLHYQPTLPEAAFIIYNGVNATLDEKISGWQSLIDDLVITLPNGRPREERLIAKAFKEFIEENGLRPVVFHSLRHLSTSLKLRASGGDIKAVQGDTGHAQASMVTEVYSTTFTENRKRIADKMQENFFDAEPNAQTGLAPETKKLIDLLEKNPELNALILAMAQKSA